MTALSSVNMLSVLAVHGDPNSQTFLFQDGLGPPAQYEARTPALCQACAKSAFATVSGADYCGGVHHQVSKRHGHDGSALAAGCAMNRAIDFQSPLSKTLQHRGRLAWVAALCLGLWVAGPNSTCRAEDAPSVVGYGFEGLGTGAAMGLGIGYLSTGSDWDSSEWKNLVYGTAIGALSGLGVGLLLGIIDAGTSRGRGIGFYMVRDSNYGVSVGFVVGGIVGILQWMGDDGSGKDLLRGLAWGTVIGGGAGFLVGILEGALRGGGSSNADPAGPSYDSTHASRMHFGVSFTSNERGGVGTPYPTLSGRF
jgi:hypothetical protein